MTAGLSIGKISEGFLRGMIRERSHVFLKYCCHGSKKASKGTIAYQQAPYFSML
ncbi:hypothetical protein GCK32_011521 [Trichostrongylus colubriformis]|uniref:Uncharacterized protein n=1 Tax=Trichostrongylus colubriformis TaxID=6319 RepID=A0AAN8J0E6_TRICO